MEINGDCTVLQVSFLTQEFWHKWALGKRDQKGEGSLNDLRYAVTIGKKQPGR